MIRHLLATAVILAAAPALADEVWSSDYGEVIYENDIEGQAILSMQLGGEGRGLMYFPGLAGNYDDRSTHHGYWIMPGGGPCEAELTGVDGFSGGDWGRVVISFDKAAFPTSWTATFGQCFDDYSFSLRGETQ